MDRNVYRRWLLDGLAKKSVSLLSYCITSNHVHLLVCGKNEEEIGMFMQYVAGGSAQAYNLRKNRTGGYWSDRYHATMVENGEHLWRCMRYIDLNMVRAGVVEHPRAWDWTGWAELMGERRRNRLIDMDAVLEAVDLNDVNAFRIQYAELIEGALRSGADARESCWSEAVAVGGRSYIEAVEGELLRTYTRRRLERIEETGGAVALHEASALYAYGTENRVKK